ncbi:beta-glucosidase 11-like [Prosopis cineraria]|uniref:beta-glucosidase 11-like n=1 Tax=Prosopis cineraria TaxID=364024 RepID=UPI00240FBD39|nr:beta-glucosidase 11-like [Prosopis cineraria]XP_054789023.1 beta-glucosidase 11-like [Prosopis cineraria]XP_054789033.1 beta-glucosidase 11-like [Prosopis cineraria]
MLGKALLAALISLVAASATDPYSRDDFPPDFFFGAATSAFQVEGADDEDGRTPSIFDTYARTAYGMSGGYGHKSCDQYHKYKEDVALMAKMGLNAYRFSISWSRLIPNGKGPVNPKGLEYYNNLIDELISHDIQPHVTLHHSDLPQALEDEYGGWLSRRVVRDFKTYADVCFREFGDRVKYWTTMNEPNIFVIGGYDSGFLPPQRCSTSSISNCSKGNSSTEPYIAAHNILLSHAAAASLYRKKYQGKQHGFIGINILTFVLLPLTNSTEDLGATERAKDLLSGWFLNPIMFGDYPDMMKKNIGSRLPSFTKTESNIVKGSIDFLGINYYYTSYIKNSPQSQAEGGGIFADVAVEMIENIFNATAMPRDLQKAVDSLEQSYGNIPLYIHENGQVTLRNSSLDDWPRVKYLHGHIKDVLDALRNGSNVKGYFVWSLLDLYELLGGYKISYGLYYVDLNDRELRRQPKLSAKWYANFLHRRTIDPKVIIELKKNAPMPSLHNVI